MGACSWGPMLPGIRLRAILNKSVISVNCLVQYENIIMNNMELYLSFDIINELCPQKNNNCLTCIKITFQVMAPTELESCSKKF